MDFDTLKNTIISQNDRFDIDLLEKAYHIAFQVHKNQTRKSGEPYITHPLSVANILFRIGGDENILCAALLHDVLEDCDIPQRPLLEEQILREFGEDVFFLVQAVTKNSFLHPDEIQTEYCNQFKEAMNMDVTVFFLKMGDLLHNAQTINGLNTEKQKQWISELKNQYIPLMIENYHTICFVYHDMYLNLINEAEKIIAEYENNQ